MKKVLILLVSIFCFFSLLFISVIYLNEDKNNVVRDDKNLELMKSLKELNDTFEDTRETIDYFSLDKDNLYENYLHNYSIKIPEGYKTNSGIGKFSSVQFYNENLGYVVAVNVGETNLESVDRTTNEKIIKEYENEFNEDSSSLEYTFENSLTERGFNKVKLDNYKVVDYNNRLFIRLNFSAFRTSDNQKNPVSIVNFITYNEKLIYSFMFVSYQWNLPEKWESEIQKSMSNVMISKYITKKD